MSEILVTGAAGFIGSHLCRTLLDKGYKVTGIDNYDPFYSRDIKENNLTALKHHPDFTFYELDICNFYALLDVLKHCKPAAVVHLAAKAGVLKSITDTDTYITNNISGTRNILEWMRLSQIKKLVFASSSSVYGNNNPVPFSENAFTDLPLTPYATTKKTCEMLNYNYHYIHGFDILNLRFFTVYGPAQRPDLAIHKFTKLIWKDEPVRIYGVGDSARDYTYIDDTVDGILKSLTYILNHDSVYEILNLGNNHPVPLMELVKLLYKLMEKPENFIHTEEQLGDMKITCADIQKAQELIGYQPLTPIETGLTRFVEWFKSVNTH